MLLFYNVQGCFSRENSRFFRLILEDVVDAHIDNVFLLFRNQRRATIMAKSKIDVVIDKIDKSEYATFQSMKELRDAVNVHVQTIQDSNLRPSTKRKLISLLDYLRDHSRVYFGLSFRRRSIIAEHFGVNKADTVGEWLKRLSDMGIVRIIPTKRSRDMKQTVNLVQILPPSQPTNGDKQAQEEEKIEHLEDNTLIKTNTKDHSIRKEDTYEEVYPSYIPHKFVMRVKPLFPNVKKVYELFGKVRLAYLKSTVEKPLEDLESITLTAISDALSALKLRRIKKGYSYEALKGYLYGTAHRLFLEEKRRESVRENPDLLMNFLDQHSRKSDIVKKLESLSTAW